MNQTIALVCSILLAAPAFAQSKGPAIAKDAPIEITSDALDVHQDEQKAIFTGNVIATQGGTNLRSTTMTVFYKKSDDKSASANGGAQGISKILAEGNVVFTTATETAVGDTAVYDANADTIDLTGSSVTLTREQNVLKGQKLNYNLSTGRSVLTAGGAPVSGSTGATGKPGRVHGLFVPKSDKK